tara:strand:+ start:193 stop:411 length:219 start_codon:yes stop_codon:yes gene_type:complete
MLVVRGWTVYPEIGSCFCEVDHGKELSSQGIDNSNRMQGLVTMSDGEDVDYSLARWNCHHLLALYLPLLLIA